MAEFMGFGGMVVKVSLGYEGVEGTLSCYLVPLT